MSQFVGGVANNFFLHFKNFWLHSIFCSGRTWMRSRRQKWEGEVSFDLFAKYNWTSSRTYGLGTQTVFISVPMIYPWLLFQGLLVIELPKIYRRKKKKKSIFILLNFFILQITVFFFIFDCRLSVSFFFSLVISEFFSLPPLQPAFGYFDERTK